MQSLTNKEKEKVFALYYGCDYIFDCKHNTSNPKYTVDGKCLSMYDFSNNTLLLTPLENISDEDAIEVARLCFQMLEGDFNIEKRDKNGLHIYKRNGNGIIYHCRLNFNGEVKPNMQFEADEKEPFKTFNHQIGGVSLTDKRPIPYLAIVDFYRMKGYSVPLYFGIDHACNGKTPIELNIAIPK